MTHAKHKPDDWPAILSLLTREVAKVLDFGLAKGIQVGAITGSTQRHPGAGRPLAPRHIAQYACVSAPSPA